MVVCVAAAGMKAWADRDSGHRTMTMTVETEPVADNEELIGDIEGNDENSSTQYCSDVKWNDEDLLIEINNENITIHQPPMVP